MSRVVSYTDIPGVNAYNVYEDHTEVIVSQPTRIEPTVGRVVLYYPSDDDIYYARIAGEKGKPLAAMIAWVNGDETINLAVKDMYGENYGRPFVTLIQPGEPAPERTKTKAYATWIPYQVGQAAKVDDGVEKLRKDVAELYRVVWPDRPPVAEDPLNQQPAWVSRGHEKRIAALEKLAQLQELPGILPGINHSM